MGPHQGDIERCQARGIVPAGGDGFADALALTVFDAEHSDFEERWFTLGSASNGKLLAVSHTYTATWPAGARARIISAREATRIERRQYEDEPRQRQ